MEDNSILSPLDAADLEAKGLLLKGSTAGFQKIHLRRLHRWSDKEYNSHPLEPQPLDPRAFVEIPVSLISRETAIHVGFSPEKADEIWGRWTNWPDGSPIREIDPDDGGLIIYYVDILLGCVKKYRYDVVPEDLDAWFQAMYACGISPEVRSAILNPRFEYLRLSESCNYWLEDTVRMRYRGLELIQDASRLREKKLRHAAEFSGGDPEDSKEGPTASPSPAMWIPDAAAEASKEPGHTVLYQVTDLFSVKGLSSSHHFELVDKQGDLSNLGHLTWYGRSDFSDGEARFIFTSDPRIAEHQAAYMKLLTGIHSVVIVAFRIPNTAIESLSERGEVLHLHWPSDTWKELVWSIATLRKAPRHLGSIAQATLVIGSVSRKERLKHFNVRSWEDMTEDFVFKMAADGQPGGTGEIATQYVLHDDEGWNWLEENCRRDTKIFTFGATP